MKVYRKILKQSFHSDTKPLQEVDKAHHVATYLRVGLKKALNSTYHISYMIWILIRKVILLILMWWLQCDPNSALLMRFIYLAQRVK